MSQSALEFDKILEEVTKNLPPCKVVILMRDDDCPIWKAILHRTDTRDLATAHYALHHLIGQQANKDIDIYLRAKQMREVAATDAVAGDGVGGTNGATERTEPELDPVQETDLEYQSDADLGKV